MLISRIIFAIITLSAFYLAGNQFYRVYRNIKLGKPEKIGGQEGKRWRNVLLIAFGQQKMFKRFLPAFFHLFIYTAFLLTQVELIEIFVDGRFGTYEIAPEFLIPTNDKGIEQCNGGFCISCYSSGKICFRLVSRNTNNVHPVS